MGQDLKPSHLLMRWYKDNLSHLMFEMAKSVSTCYFCDLWMIKKASPLALTTAIKQI